MKRAGVLLVAVGGVALALPLYNLFAEAPKELGLAGRTSAAHSFGHVAPVLEQKCAACHAAGVEPPIYVRLPLAGGLMRADMEQGLAALDMVAALEPEGQPTGEVALAKMEHVVAQRSMPPTRYRLLHWTSGLDEGERERTFAWVHEVRLAVYAPAGLPPAVGRRPVHPIRPITGLDQRKVALGRALYDDPRLSADDSISCASCHDLARGGSDGRARSLGVGGAEGNVNSPTVFNAAYQVAQFWDGRAATLEEQAAGPVTNPVEMASTWPQVFAKLQEDEAFMADFLAVYPGGLSADSITDAIATFERTLVTPRSRLDRFLLGDATALTTQEKRGYELFVAGGCQTCHVGKLLGGRSFEKMGRERDYFEARGDVQQADYGRFNVTGDERDRFAFKVPTLRNVALTAPYFHDGAVGDLSEAVRVMVVHQTTADLSRREIELVTRMLEANTGEYEGKLLE